MNNALGLVEAIGRAAAIVAVDTILKAANVTLIGIEPSKGGGMYAIKIEGDVGAVKAAVDSIKSLEELQNKIFTSKVIPRPAAGIDRLVYNSVTIGYEQKVEDAIREVIEQEATLIQEKVEEATEATKVEDSEPIQVPQESKADEPIEKTDEVIQPIEEAQKNDQVDVEEKGNAKTINEVDKKESSEIEQSEIDTTSEQIGITIEDTKSKVTEKPVKAVKKENKAAKKEICNLCNDPKCKRRRGEPKSLCIHHNTKST